MSGNNFNEWWSEEEAAPADKVRWEMLRLAKEHPKLSGIFPGAIYDLDSALSPPLHSGFPRMLLTTLATQFTPVPGGEQYDFTIYIIFQIERPVQAPAGERDRGMATLIYNVKNYYMDRKRLHLPVKVDGQDRALIQKVIPGIASNTNQIDPQNPTVATIVWPWNFTTYSYGP